MLVIKTILNKISIDKSCYIFIILALLSAHFQMLLIISFLLLIHECGHFFTALIFKWPTEKIVFYPFGGVSKFSHAINCSLKEEILVLLMGPIMQLIFYYFLTNVDIFTNYYSSITIINYSILIFNLLTLLQYPLSFLIYNSLLIFLKALLIIYLILIKAYLDFLISNLLFLLKNHLIYGNNLTLSTSL